MSEAKDKGKHAQHDAVLPIQKKARQDCSTAAVTTDEEVEEFYAILRRINTAVKYFKSYGDNVAALEKDIMQELKEAERNDTNNDKEQDFMSLDLNVTPTSSTN